MASSNTFIDALKRELGIADQAYHNTDKSVMTDTEYDILKRILSEQSPDLTEVGAAVTEGMVVTNHVERMRSLDNLFTEGDISEYIAYVDGSYKSNGLPTPAFSSEPKYDGLAVELIYSHGVLFNAVLRGDGDKGESVLQTARLIPDIPRTISDPVVAGSDQFVVRGEIFLTAKQFQHTNLVRRVVGDGKSYSNARNAAAGIVRSHIGDDISNHLKTLLSFAWYEVIGVDYGQEGYENYMHEFVPSFRNPYLDEYRSLLGESEGSASDFIAAGNIREQLSFGIDGIVLKVIPFSARQILPGTPRYPGYSTAVKFSAITAQTTLTDITFQVGRTGAVTPVAEFATVYLDGVAVKNASLFNSDRLEYLKLKPGDPVVVFRAGDVVPQITSVAGFGRHDGYIKMPALCPECESELVRRSGESVTVCPSQKCPGKLAAKMVHFVKRENMDIDGIGEKTAEKLGHAVTRAGLYSLSIGQIQEITGFTALRATGLYDSIVQSKRVSPDRFLRSMGIDGIGEGNARRICEHLDVKTLMTIDPKLLSSIHGLGESAVESLRQVQTDEDFVAEWNELLSVLFIESPSAPETVENGDTPLFVVTGDFRGIGRFSGITSRKEVMKLLAEELGVRVTDKWSNEVSGVIVGASPGKSKLMRARAKGLPEISVF